MIIKNKTKDEASFFQVIQSNVSSKLKNQNITLYFNLILSRNGSFSS